MPFASHAAAGANRSRPSNVRLTDGRALPEGDQRASLVSGTSRQFLVYENYDALLSYNCAHAYALGIALLSDRIATPDSR